MHLLKAVSSKEIFIYYGLKGLKGLINNLNINCNILKSSALCFMSSKHDMKLLVMHLVTDLCHLGELLFPVRHVSNKHRCSM